MLKSLLQKILDKAHEGHTYIKDKEQYGLNEYWEPGLLGDCEDFALWCRDELKKHNIESDLVYCKTETGAGHLVLHVQGWILDNRYKWVMNKDDLDYTWIKLGQPDGTWKRIHD